MVELALALTPGESDFERALFQAGVLKNVVYLTALLRQPGFELSLIDRHMLADYIEGRYANGVGRRSAERKTALEVTLTPAQQAAVAVRNEIDERRRLQLPIRGQRAAMIEKFAAQFGVKPSTVEGHLNRSRKPTRK